VGLAAFGGQDGSVRYVQQSSEMLSVAVRAQLRALLWAAFERFSEHDWEHSLGGTHVMAIHDGVPVGHAAIIRRPVYVDEAVVDAGYVEAVAVDARWRRTGIGSAVMRQAGLVIEGFGLGILSTHRHRFYERLGWQRWQGPTFVREDGRWRRTPDEDAGIMALPCGHSGSLDLSASIAVDARVGDDW
jgi:aminoglycoside 2'-N-acetyltransferase I